MVDYFFEINFCALGESALYSQVQLFSTFAFSPLAGLDHLADHLCHIEAWCIRNHFKFKLCGLTDKAHRPYRVFDSGQLHNNLVFSLAKHDRLCNPELVDAVPDNLQ